MHQEIQVGDHLDDDEVDDRLRDYDLCDCQFEYWGHEIDEFEEEREEC